MFWIKDLSVSDPYLVLPIIMGISQLIQVRMGPQAGDPMQRRMFQIMPIGDDLPLPRRSPAAWCSTGSPTTS